MAHPFACQEWLTLTSNRHHHHRPAWTTTTTTAASCPQRLLCSSELRRTRAAWRAWRSHAAAQQESEARLGRAHEFLRGYFRRLTAGVNAAAAACVRDSFGRWRALVAADAHAAALAELADRGGHARLATVKRTIRRIEQLAIARAFSRCPRTRRAA